MDTKTESIRPAPRIDGQAITSKSGTQISPANENSAEMIELYWMALMRDVHFVDYVTTGAPSGNVPQGWPAGNLAADTAKDLNDPIQGEGGPRLFQAFLESYPVDAATGLVTPATLFRGSAPGDNIGPYISQFLLRGNTAVDASDRTRPPVLVRSPDAGMVSHGTQAMNQRQRTVLPFRDYLMDTTTWRQVQEGTDDPSFRDAYDDPAPRFIRNLRDLGNWVHLDYLYQHFLNAAADPHGRNGLPREWRSADGYVPVRRRQSVHRKPPERTLAKSDGFRDLRPARTS
ncbi:MAG: hypothetical protein H0U02_10120 [Rubrobacter sp.]|nr:hypothetical protein [Rubrobacter sp.]